MLTASIFSRHGIQEAATIFLLGFHFSICALFHSQLRAVIFRRPYGVLVFRALPFFAFSKSKLKCVFLKNPGLQGFISLIFMDLEDISNASQEQTDFVVRCICSTILFEEASKLKFSSTAEL